MVDDDDDDNGRTTEPAYTYKLIHMPKGSGELKLNSSKSVSGIKLRLFRSIYIISPL